MESVEQLIRSSGQFGEQRTGHRMARTLYAHRAKVHRQHIKRGFGAALHRGSHQRREAVHPLALHGLDQQRAGSTA